MSYYKHVYTHPCIYSRLWIYLFVIHIYILMHTNIHTHTQVWIYHATPFSSCTPSYPLLFHSYIRISTRAKAYVRPRPRCGLGQHAHAVFRWYACTFSHEKRHIHIQKTLQWITVRGLRFRQLYIAGTKDLRGCARTTQPSSAIILTFREICIVRWLGSLTVDIK